MFSSEFNKIFNENYSVEQLGITTSAESLKPDSHLPKKYFLFASMIAL